MTRKLIVNHLLLISLECNIFCLILRYRLHTEAILDLAVRKFQNDDVSKCGTNSAVCGLSQQSGGDRVKVDSANAKCHLYINIM